MEDLSAFSAKPRLRLLLDHFAKRSYVISSDSSTERRRDTMAAFQSSTRTSEKN